MALATPCLQVLRHGWRELSRRPSWLVVVLPRAGVTLFLFSSPRMWTTDVIVPAARFRPLQLALGKMMGIRLLALYALFQLFGILTWLNREQQEFTPGKSIAMTIGRLESNAHFAASHSQEAASLVLDSSWHATFWDGRWPFVLLRGLTRDIPIIMRERGPQGGPLSPLIFLRGGWTRLRTLQRPRDMAST
eukprot:5225744-Amphidinium_carterae.1